MTPILELPIVDPAIWGPHLWRFLHFAAEGSVDGPSRTAVWGALFSAMRTGLPCPECTEHYTAWHDMYPLVVTDATGLRGPVQAWTRDLHNAVNERRGVATWTPEEVTATFGAGGGRAEARTEARAALAAAAAAGVGSWVISAGETVIRRAML